MFKNILKGIAIGSAALAITAGAAQADTIEVNLYGASAQFKFWTNAAPYFLKDQGCADADNYAVNDKDTHDRDTGIAVCVSSTDPVQNITTGAGINGDTVVLRYTTKASYDGIRAVTADARFDEDGCGSDMRLQGDFGVEADQSDYAALQPWDTVADEPNPGSTIPLLTCQDVHIGASDVAARTFAQVSNGYEEGHLGGDWEERDISYPSALLDPEDLGYQVDRPIVVPFGFFANNGLAADDPLTTMDETVAVPFDNLSRLMAVSIFSGQVANWNDFDPSLPNLSVTACLRHAGSGTAATLNAAVMRGDSPLVTDEVPVTDIAYMFGLVPAIYFNDGSSDEMRCVGQIAGAVGYADVDKCIDGCDGDYGSVKSLTWQGVAGSATAIKHGQYDFWSAQWLYSNESGDVDAVIDALAAYASIEENLPSSKAPYWAAQNAMMWEKSTDYSYPVKK